MSSPTVSFNGVDLASRVPGLSILSTNPYRIPGRSIQNDKLANADKSVNAAAYWQEKKINVRIIIGRNTRALFEDSLDALTAILQAENATLLFNFGSSTRQWTATLANISVQEVLGGLGEIELEFQCSDPLGYDVASTPLITSAYSGSTSTDSFVIGGSFAWQAPIITITLTAITGGTDKTITVGNPATGQQISIFGTWVNNDVIVIDCQNKTVKVNGVDVDFDGAIPEWQPGAGTMSYSDDLTTRVHSHSAIYYKRYL